MSLRRIAKSSMARISRKHGNPIVAHLTHEGESSPLCTAAKPARARWLEADDPAYAAVRDCKNCVDLAVRDGFWSRRSL